MKGDKMNKPTLKNGLNHLQNLKVCISEGTATAETFEKTIEVEGLTMEMIYLISDYYKNDCSKDDVQNEGCAQ